MCTTQIHILVIKSENFLSATGGRVDMFHMSPEKPYSMSGIFIKHVSENSPAGRSGLLKKGDRILEVNEL